MKKININTESLKKVVSESMKRMKKLKLTKKGAVIVTAAAASVTILLSGLAIHNNNKNEKKPVDNSNKNNLTSNNVEKDIGDNEIILIDESDIETEQFVESVKSHIDREYNDIFEYLNNNVGSDELLIKSDSEAARVFEKYNSDSVVKLLSYCSNENNGNSFIGETDNLKFDYEKKQVGDVFNFNAKLRQGYDRVAEFNFKNEKKNENINFSISLSSSETATANLIHKQSNNTYIKNVLFNDKELAGTELVQVSFDDISIQAVQHIDQSVTISILGSGKYADVDYEYSFNNDEENNLEIYIDICESLKQAYQNNMTFKEYIGQYSDLIQTTFANGENEKLSTLTK